MPDFVTYSTSGSWRGGELARWGAVEAGGAVAGGALYQRLVEAIAAPGMIWMLPIAAGWLAGYSTYAALIRAHCRSRLVGGGVAVAAAALFLATSHYVSYTRDFLPAARAVRSIRPTAPNIPERRTGPAGYLEFRMSEGWPPVRSGLGKTLDRHWIPIAWSLEALVVFSIAAFTTVSLLRRPYCERCRAWTHSEIIGIMRRVPPHAIRSAYLSGSVDSFSSLEDDPTLPDVQAERRWLEFSVESCLRCHETHFLSVFLRGFDPKLEQSAVGRESLVSHILASDEQIARLRARVVPRSLAPTQYLVPRE